MKTRYDRYLRALRANRKKGTQNYEENIYDTCRALVKKWPDPDKLSPAKRKQITKLFRYASFASFGPEQNL